MRNLELAIIPIDVHMVLVLEKHLFTFFGM